jgi:hypothetical protein
MAKQNTVWGAFDISLGNEINRIKESLEKMGIQNVSKIEASALIAEKNKRAKMSSHEVFSFISKLRGIGNAKV